MKRIKESDVSEGLASCITAILSYSKGFMCSTGPGSVSLFEKIQEDSYKMSMNIQVNIRK